MPLYAYQCQSCLLTFDAFHKVDDRGSVTPCPTCRSAWTARQITAARITPDYAGYHCPVTGKWVEGRVAHEENLKRHGCRLLEPGETAAVPKYHAAQEAALDSALDQTIGEFVEALPQVSKERLAAELDNGLDIAVERQ
jgi:putative FmdB family regulatory protein